MITLTDTERDNAKEAMHYYIALLRAQGRGITECCVL